ncbi:DUF397 domain-containing protein [Micromonospora zingiberis]|uniref:DUF397 domain-containing protein n=1 Tax=Micromonospora zingiberis TaxID=2053011 RepID=A0A4R0GTH9_9ACTN|nr:DUF397 domain-containing protein [Micromonospora zingiberis]TCC00378.1 DUF397 domain-containing protein [Micromonospora zingiberis]
MSDISGARWRKSSYSNEGACVEVADGGPGFVGVRDSKDVAGPALSFGPSAWRSFVESVKHDGLS